MVPMTPPAEVHFYPELARGDGYRLLAAIHLAENPNDVTTPGPNGELGPFQFRRTTWERLTTLPFTVEYACDRQFAFSLAVIYYHEIRLALLRAGIEPTPTRIAAAWNAGAGAVIRGTTPPSALQYATRVCNIFYAHKR